MVSDTGERSDDFELLVPDRILLDFIVQVVINGLDLSIENPDHFLDAVFDLGNCGSG